MAEPSAELGFGGLPKDFPLSGANESAAGDQGSAPARGGVDVGKLVAGGFTVVSTSIAIVGGITGAVSRFLRNNPVPLLAALILSVAAVGISLAGTQLVTAGAGNRTSGKRAGSTGPATTTVDLAEVDLAAWEADGEEADGRDSAEADRSRDGLAASEAEALAIPMELAAGWPVSDRPDDY